MGGLDETHIQERSCRAAREIDDAITQAGREKFILATRLHDPFLQPPAQSAFVREYRRLFSCSKDAASPAKRLAERWLARRPPRLDRRGRARMFAISDLTVEARRLRPHRHPS